jgi:hypothetical protein
MQLDELKAIRGRYPRLKVLSQIIGSRLEDEEQSESDLQADEDRDTEGIMVTAEYDLGDGSGPLCITSLWLFRDLVSWRDSMNLETVPHSRIQYIPTRITGLSKITAMRRLRVFQDWLKQFGSSSVETLNFAREDYIREEDLPSLSKGMPNLCQLRLRRKPFDKRVNTLVLVRSFPICNASTFGITSSAFL